MPIDREILGSFLALCKEAGTPFSYKASLRALASDWVWLVSQEPNPASYTDVVSYAWDAQVAAYFRKYDGLPTGIDTKAKAIDAFWAAEKQCYATNERLSPLLFDSCHYGEGVRRLLGVWRKEIRRVLGAWPGDWIFQEFGRFGPGSTFGNAGNTNLVFDKFSDSYTRTSTTDFLLPLWDQTAWSRYAACGAVPDFVRSVTSHEEKVEELSGLCHPDFAVRDFEVVQGNRFTTVKKNSRTDRGICVEPSLNVFYQLAIGRQIENRLGRVYGWKKATIQDDHRLMARIGSLTGAVATIDLSSASDTVCKNLVRLLLPRTWFEYLDRCRSKATLIGDRWYRVEKFSSMGNGFTFELETLIFYTLCKSLALLQGVREDPFTPGLAVSCFGDDIIVPSSLAELTVSALSFFGFKTNGSKTFISGPFRESCGGDYYRGSPVRPHYPSGGVDTPDKALSLANGLRRFYRNAEACGGFPKYLAWNQIVRSIPSEIRKCRGPEIMGDLVLHDPQWLTKNPHVTRHSIRYLRVWRPVLNRTYSLDHWRPGVVLCAQLYGAFLTKRVPVDGRPLTSRELGGVVPRIGGSFVDGYRFGRVPFS